jgi:hypothetical protein
LRTSHLHQAPPLPLVPRAPTAVSSEDEERITLSLWRRAGSGGRGWAEEEDVVRRRRVLRSATEAAGWGTGLPGRDPRRPRVLHLLQARRLRLLSVRPPLRPPNVRPLPVYLSSGVNAC